MSKTERDEYASLKLEALLSLIRPSRISVHLVVLALFVIQIIFVACTSPNDPTVTPSVSTPTSAPATSTPQPTATATAPPTAGLTKGGVIRFALKEAPPHQDVHQSVSNVLATWGAGIAYSRLLRFQRGANVPVTSRIPECDLCTAWQQTGPLEFEFELRDDAFWPAQSPMNGRAVVAADIEFSYRRQMTSDWPNAELLSNVEGIEAVDSTHLKIRLKAPDAEFFEKLADGRSVIVAREAVELSGDLINGPTLGSGPWILEEISSGSATFEANRSYYGDGPYLDGLSIQFIAQDSTRAAGVRANVLDFAETTQEEVRSALDRFPGLQTLTLNKPGTGVELALNSSSGPLGSASVREAVFLAWDLTGAMNEIWDGELAPSVGLNLPEPSWAADFNGQYSGKFNSLAEAMRLLNEVGLSPDDSVTIAVGEFGEAGENNRYIQTAKSLASALNAAGLTTTVTPVTTRVFADNVWLQGEYDIFIGAPPPISSLSGQLFGIYHSAGPWNTTGFSSATLDELIEAQAIETNRVRRGELLLQIQDEIMNESQRFYPGTGVEHWLWQPSVRDFVPDTSGASGDFLTRVWLSRE